MANTNGVHWYGHMMTKKDGNVLRSVVDYKVEAEVEAELKLKV